MHASMDNGCGLPLTTSRLSMEGCDKPESHPVLVPKRALALASVLATSLLGMMFGVATSVVILSMAFWARTMASVTILSRSRERQFELMVNRFDVCSFPTRSGAAAGPKRTGRVRHDVNKTLHQTVVALMAGACVLPVRRQV